MGMMKVGCIRISSEVSDTLLAFMVLVRIGTLAWKETGCGASLDKNQILPLEAKK